MKMTIIVQINKFLINLFDFEFDLKNSGRTKTKTAIKKIAGTICSTPILIIPKNFSFLEKFFYTWIRSIIFYFSELF